MPFGSDDESSVRTEDDPGVEEDSLRSKVYALRREHSNVSMPSPPRSNVAPSDFEACSGIVKDQSSQYRSFPESSHLKSALHFVNEAIADPSSLKGSANSGGNKFVGFGPTSFSGKFKSKDFEIHGSSLGKSVPSCDKLMSQLIGAKPVDGLRLSQSLWAKSENCLRSLSHVLGTAEHFLAAAGSLLKGQESEDLKSFLLQVDQALGAAQLLTLGTLSNFSLSKREEILDKSPVSESLKETLRTSPLSDKLFGLTVERVQEELKKAPPTVKVDVQLSGKRTVTTSHSSSSATKSSAPKPDGQNKRKRGNSYFQNQGHSKKPRGNKSKTESSRGNQSGK